MRTKRDTVRLQPGGTSVFPFTLTLGAPAPSSVPGSEEVPNSRSTREHGRSGRFRFHVAVNDSGPLPAGLVVGGAVP